MIDETPINEEVSIDVGFEVPKIMNKSAEEEIVIEKEHLKGKNETIDNETIEDETKDKMSYSRNRENLLEEVNNRKIEDIEVKEIEIETGNEQEEGLENKKVKYEGIETEGMNEKEHDIDTVELFEKENELNNEDLIRKGPIIEGNNEGEIILEGPKQHILINN